jgi:ribose-phosphate pyrophosphokinase
MLRIKYGHTLYPHKTFVFSGGEVQVKLGEYPFRGFPNALRLEAHITNSNDFMELALAVDAIRRRHGSHVELYLTLPYLPYARQDRAMTDGESLALKVFIDLLNSLKLDAVEVWDVHSDVALALINNVRHRPVENILSSEILGDSILVAPDAGSLKKVSAVAKKFGRRMVRADKTRSVIDGSITGTVVYSENVGDSDFLIVDDICDGGRTFFELGKELRKLTTGRVELYITHGIFSKGVEAIDAVFDKIYCAVPFPGVDLKNPKLTIIGGL